MQLIHWTDGNFGMCAHNYEGDVLTDEIAQMHRSPGFLSSVLNGVRDDGSILKELKQVIERYLICGRRICAVKKLRLILYQ